MDRCPPSMSKVGNIARIMANACLCCLVCSLMRLTATFLRGKSQDLPFISTICKSYRMAFASSSWLCCAKSLHAKYGRLLSLSHHKLQTSLVTALNPLPTSFSRRGEILDRERERSHHLRGGRSQGSGRAAHAGAIRLRSRSGESAVGGCIFRLVSER